VIISRRFTMSKVIKNLGSKSAAIILVLVLGAWPVGGLAQTFPGGGRQNLQERIDNLKLRISNLEQRIKALMERIRERLEGIASPSR
jgi:hypothetical protein